MDSILTLMRRLNKIGIDIELASNYPWVYLCKINEHIVTEKYLSKHYFTVGFMPIKKDDTFNLSNISEIFKIIRKYSK